MLSSHACHFIKTDFSCKDYAVSKLNYQQNHQDVYKHLFRLLENIRILKVSGGLASGKLTSFLKLQVGICAYVYLWLFLGQDVWFLESCKRPQPKS